MTTASVKTKIVTLEAEIKLLKKAFGEKLDLTVDEFNWQALKPAVKKARQKMFKKAYG